MMNNPKYSVKKPADPYEKGRGTIEGQASGGDLRVTPSRKLIDRLYSGQFTGALLLSHGRRKKKLWFYQGEIFKVQTNLSPELFGSLMLERNLLNKSDLNECLRIQKEREQGVASSGRLGDFVHELFGIDEDELDALFDHQRLASFMQALTWRQGTYEIIPYHLAKPECDVVSYERVMQSLKTLLEVGIGSENLFSEGADIWKLDSSAVELSSVPFWLILAGCRAAGASGIIYLRRKKQLFEVLVKKGIPMTLYEGSFASPRQTVIARQASEEHERYFVNQIFEFFSYLSGTVYFKSADDGNAQLADDNGEEEGTKIAFGAVVADKPNNGSRLKTLFKKFKKFIS